MYVCIKHIGGDEEGREGRGREGYGRDLSD